MAVTPSRISSKGKKGINGDEQEVAPRKKDKS